MDKMDKINILEKYQKYIDDIRLFPEILRTKKLENELKEQEIKLKEQEVQMKEQEVRMKEQEIKLKEQEVRMKEQEVRMKEQEIKLKEQEVNVKEQEIFLKEQETKLKEQDVFVRYQDTIKYNDEITYVRLANEQIIEGLRLKNLNERIDILHNLGLKNNEDDIIKIIKFSKLLGLSDDSCNDFENLLSDKIKKNSDIKKSIYS